MRAIGDQALNIRFGAPQSREVELVRALRELRHSGEPVGCQRRDPDLEVQVRHELRQALSLPHLGAERAALRVVEVSLAVLIGHYRTIESPDMLEEVAYLVRRRGQRHGQNLRGAALGLGAFLRIVVDKDKAVEPQVQLFRQRYQILRLGFPIDAPGGEMPEPERHFGIALKRFDHVGLVVLAGHREEHACLALSQHELLQLASPRIECDAGGSVFAADAAPQRVVAVQRDRFVGTPRQRMRAPHQRRA